MKVVHVFWGLTFGGIETMLVNIANEQVKLGADVSVVIINNLSESTLLVGFDPRVNVICLGRKRGSRGVGFIWRLNRVLDKLSPDAIHLHSSKIRCFPLKKNLSRVMSSTLHALPSGTVRRAGFLPRVFPCLNYGLRGNTTVIDIIPRVFAISQAVHDELLNKYGVNSLVINNGIITRSFTPRSFDRPLGGKVKIVMVSRLEHDKKGQDLLIRAASNLPDVAIDFIGIGSSHDYLQSLIEELGVANRMRLLGKRDQSYIRELLCDYDIFAQPSRYEGFGLTVAEAMAAQVPVLVSSGQGPAEVTCNDKYGWVFENGNTEDLTEKIKYIIGHYQEALEKAVQARQYVVDNYDVSVTAKMYLEHYMD